MQEHHLPFQLVVPGHPGESHSGEPDDDLEAFRRAAAEADVVRGRLLQLDHSEDCA